MNDEFARGRVTAPLIAAAPIGDTMNEELDSAAAIPTGDPAESPVVAKRSPGVRITGLLGTSAPVVSTALIAAIEPKLPPFRGD